MRNDGGPAFPRTLPTGEFPPDECAGIIAAHEGMSKRELFAAMAMQGFASVMDKMPANTECISASHLLAAMSVKCADALISELSKGGKEK